MLHLQEQEKKINITYVNQNRYSYASHDYNMPSRFIDELPKDLVEIKDSNYLENNNFFDNFITSQDNYQNRMSPGRKRLVSNYKSSDLEWDFNQDTSNEENMKQGDRVFHQKFGYGKILFIEGDKAKVDFEKSSQKQVFVKYLQFMN